MKTKTLVTALTTAILAVGANSITADESQPWHITAQIGAGELDSARDTRDDDVWKSIGFGRFFGNNFSLDIEYDEFTGTFRNFNNVVPGATYDDWKLSNWGLMGRWHIGSNNWRPYLAAGLGRQKHRSVLDEGRATSLSLGLGIQGKVAKHFSLRAQALYRQDRDGQSLAPRSQFEDWFFSFGASFDWGGSEPPPPPPPEPAPEPAPPPPNPDLDGDGVMNEHDKCPNTRPGAVVDLDGCEVEAVIELEGVHFDFDKATLRPEAKTILDEAAALLNKNERVVVEVAGHTDSTGSESYNQGLSERRANSVQDYLVGKGVKAHRLSSKGYGESMPVASNDTKEGRAENRRVELIVLDR